MSFLLRAQICLECRIFFIHGIPLVHNLVRATCPKYGYGAVLLRPATVYQWNWWSSADSITPYVLLLLSLSHRVRASYSILSVSDAVDCLVYHWTRSRWSSDRLLSILSVQQCRRLPWVDVSLINLLGTDRIVTAASWLRLSVRAKKNWKATDKKVMRLDVNKLMLWWTQVV